MASTTKQVWDALVALIAGITIPESNPVTKSFVDVRVYPFEKIRDAQFLKDIPDLQMPACLVVFKGKNTTGAKSNMMWSAITVRRDPKGKASEDAVADMDNLVDELIDNTVMSGSVWILPDARVAAVSTDIRTSVYEVAFETLEER